MAASTKNNSGKTGAKKKDSYIDPLYEKYTKSVIRALGSTEFYEFFMDAVSRAENRFQFSNRKMEKTVDLNWVDAIEESLPAIQNIISSPRNIIREEELIVNVANAKKAGSDVVRHLAQHASLVEKYDFETGEVRPSKLMQKYREDTIGLYENRLVFTALETAFQFVKIRHDALFSAMSDEFGAKLKVDSTMETATELVRVDMFMHIKETDSAIETDDKNGHVFDRISKIYRILSVLMRSQFAQQMERLPRVKGALTKTNVLKKNPDYRRVLALLEFLRSYEDIGYTIRVVEQNPEIDGIMERDIYHNILFNYLILKGYLEDERDRVIPAPARGRKRTLKPKFIKEIIEELTEDYDLPDIEIRKVLIEELTKEQLMLEEEAERRRLVEEQERRRLEEQERLRLEAEAEEARRKKAEEEEKERIRKEEEAEKQRLFAEKMEREAEDRRRTKIFRDELDRFMETLEERKEAREAAVARRLEEIRAFEEAQRKIEEEKRRKEEEAERIRLEKEAEEERLHNIQAQREAEDIRRCEIFGKEIESFASALEQRKEARVSALERRMKEKAAFEETARLMEEAEQKKIEAEIAAREERERIVLEKEQLKEQAEKDEILSAPYKEEIVVFLESLPKRIAIREAENRRIRLEKEQRELERQRRLAARAARG
ncbi:MAG: DUF2357 domain-containing protein [Oscillospiraceae bacterium]|nr:DUF2357 domain-containing protein [Oscillospiraceae bacterium]